MKLREQHLNFTQEAGSPEPIIFTKSNTTILLFYAEDSDGNIGTGVIEFTGVLQVKMGPPNDETLASHRYYSMGLEPYAYFIVEGSDVIEELKAANRIHPRHDENTYEQYQHYIFTFKDGLFECIARQVVYFFVIDSILAVLRTRMTET